jgi:hypothetical protein
MIDGGPFQGYRRIVGEHELGDFSLTVLSVPPDALGGPARLRLSIDRARAGLDGAWSSGDIAREVLEDAIVRGAVRALSELAGPSAASAPGSGRIWIDPPGPELAERTSARVDQERIYLALSLDLPAADRRVRGHQAETILFDLLPRVGMGALLFPLRRTNEVKSGIEAVTRRRVEAAGLSGRGLAAVLPSAGLTIPTGISLFVTSNIAGAGVWLHGLVAPTSSVSPNPAILAGPASLIAASRRAFGPLDLRAFVRACPELPDPEAYVTEDAPAPLAVAASLVEAFEAGARILVLDEDETPAAVFGGGERIEGVLGGPPSLLPLGERLAELRDRWGLSFFVAARATGSLADVADSIFILRDDRIEDATDAFRRARRASSARRVASPYPLAERPTARSMRVLVDGAPGRLRVGAWGSRGVRVGEDLVDLSDTTLTGNAARLRAVAALLKRAAVEASSWRWVTDVLDVLETAAARPVLDRLEEPGLVDLARPTRIELAAALVRWKRVTFRIGAGRLAATAEDPP